RAAGGLSVRGRTDRSRTLSFCPLVGRFRRRLFYGLAREHVLGSLVCISFHPSLLVGTLRRRRRCVLWHVSRFPLELRPSLQWILVFAISNPVVVAFLVASMTMVRHARGLGHVIFVHKVSSGVASLSLKTSVLLQVSGFASGEELVVLACLSLGDPLLSPL